MYVARRSIDHRCRKYSAAFGAYRTVLAWAGYSLSVTLAMPEGLPRWVQEAAQAGTSERTLDAPAGPL
jgi:hypothetical protein